MCGRRVGMGLLVGLLVLALAGCRKTREVPFSEGEPVAEGEINPYGTADSRRYQPVPPGPETSGEGDSPRDGAASENDPSYPMAVAIPGKPGFVFNPYTNGVVDVRGIPSKTLVKDPQDPDKGHIFRLP